MTDEGPGSAIEHSAGTCDAVLFDLGNTLVDYYRADDFEPILARCVAAALEVLAEHGHDGVDAQLALVRAHECNRERSDGRVWPLAERLHEIFAPAGAARAPLEAALLARVVDAFLGPIFATARPDPRAVPVLETLRARGLKTAIVSNTPWGSPATAWYDELDRYGLRDCVDAVVFCVDVGWRKPARQPFDVALARLGVAAAQAVFVGDDARWDVEGARRAGIAPILLRRGSAVDVDVDDKPELPPDTEAHVDIETPATADYRWIGSLDELLEVV